MGLMEENPDFNEKLEKHLETLKPGAGKDDETSEEKGGDKPSEPENTEVQDESTPEPEKETSSEGGEEQTVEAEGGDESPESESEEDKGEGAESSEAQEGEEPQIGDSEVLGWLNSELGTDYKSVEDLKGSLKNTEVQTQVKDLQSQLEDLQSKYAEAKSQLDPRKHFVNEEEYKRQLILQKYGQEVNPSALNKIVSSDFDNMSDLEVLTLAKQITNPNLIGGEAGARELVLDSLGLDSDTDLNDLGTLERNKLADQAASARREIGKLRDIEVPEVRDLDAARQEAQQQHEQKVEELKGKWADASDKMLNSFENFNVYDTDKDGNRQELFSFKVDDNFKSEARNALVDMMANNEVGVSDETIQEAKQYLQDVYLRKNFSKMIKAYGEDVAAKITEQKDKETDNPKEIEDSQPPASETDKQQKELEDWVKNQQSKSTAEGQPLFGQ